MFSYFEGGLQSAWIEARRGRERVVQTSRVEELRGREALADALSDPRIGTHPNSDGSGTVVLRGDPGHLAVDRVERRVRVRPGADQYREIGERLKDFPERLARDRERTRSERPGLEESLRGAEGRLSGELGERRRASDEESALWDRAHRLAWRIGEQRAIERVKEQIARLERELAEQIALRDRLREELERERRRPGDPDRPRVPWWHWGILAAAVAALIAAILELLRRRRRGAGVV